MAALISLATSSVAGLIATLVMVASLVGSGAYVDHRIMSAKFASFEASAAKAQAEAVADAAARQKELDDATLSAAQAETDTQRRLAAGTRAQLSYLRAHPTHIPCVPWAFVRVLNASILGVAADSIRLPAGAADGACAPVSADTLARTLVANFGNARANAEQLSAFQQWARQVAGVKQ